MTYYNIAFESDYAGFDLHPETEADSEKLSEKEEVKLFTEGLTEEFHGESNKFTEKELEEKFSEEVNLEYAYESGYTGFDSHPEIEAEREEINRPLSMLTRSAGPTTSRSSLWRLKG